MTARGPMLHHLTPDGTSVAHGLLSTTAEDFARFGMLFTPSWDKAAVKPVVSAEVLKRLQTAGSPEAYKRGAKYKDQIEEFGESPLMNSFQFDGCLKTERYGNTGISDREFTSTLNGISWVCTSLAMAISLHTVKTRCVDT
jgi:hypothetical protein